MSGAALAAAASFGLNFANSLIQTNSQIKQLKQQAALKNLEGDIYESSAAAQANADAYNEDMDRKARDLELSRLRATTAQSGVTGGTLIDLQLHSEQEAEMDNLMQRYNNHTAYVATMYEAQKAYTEAEQYLANAKSAKKNKWINAFFGGATAALGTASSSGLFNSAGAENMGGTKEITEQQPDGSYKFKTAPIPTKKPSRS